MTAKAKTRVFLVDDHPIVARGFQLLLQLSADLFYCGEADDAPAALTKIWKARPDLVVLDLVLKNGSGLDLLKQLRTIHPRLKILVFSMHEEAFYAERVFHAGAQGYVSKHEGTEKLVDAIRELVKDRLYLSAGLASKILGKMSGRSPVRALAVESLSNREMEILEMIGAGVTTRSAATRLGLSIKTIESHREHIKTKLNLANGSELATYAFNWVHSRRASQ